MPETVLDQFVRHHTTASMSDTFRLAIEKIGEEIAKEILSDPVFRTSLHALVKANSEAILQQMAAPAPENADEH